MRTIGILLIIGAGLGYLASTIAIGDIGLSFAFTSTISLLVGIGFLIAAKPVNALKNQRVNDSAFQSTKRTEELRKPNT
jgi:hypothetical protein